MVMLLWRVGMAQQADRPPAPATRIFLIQNARIVQAPGKVLEKGAVLIENGLITQVGTNLTAPYDAQIIKADSMTVYAGFIDGFSMIAQSKPKDEPLPRIPRPAEPTFERAGITPHRDVRSFLKPDENSVEEWRNLGFLAAQVVPYGQMMPGETALILMGGDSPSKMVLIPHLAQAGQFAAAARGQGQGVYPSNILGIMAMWRQAFLSAKRNMQYEAQYEKNRMGMSRPEYDPVLTALYPVVKGEQSVAFFTEDQLGALRFLRLRDELGFRGELYGLRNGFEILSTLKTANLPIFLSLNLPEEPKAAADSTKTPEAGKRTEKPSDVAAETARLRQRQTQVRNQYYAQAATFQQAGIPFGFTTREAKSSSIRKAFTLMLKNGLREDDLLAALTVTPARLLGAEAQLGSIEKGKVANLILADGPIFAEKTQIRTVFVDGKPTYYPIAKPAGNEGGRAKETPKQGERPKDAPKQPENRNKAAIGTWKLSVMTPNGEETATLILKEAADALAGSVKTSDGQDMRAEKIKLNGTNLTLTVTGTSFSADLDVILKGDTLEGTATVSGNALPLTGTRTSKPE